MYQGNHKTTALGESPRDTSPRSYEWKEIGKDFLKSAAHFGYAYRKSLLNNEVPKTESELQRDLAQLPLNTTPDKDYNQTPSLDQPISNYESQLEQDTFDLTNRNTSPKPLAFLGDIGSGILQYAGITYQISELTGTNMVDFASGETALGAAALRGAYGATQTYNAITTSHERIKNYDIVSKPLQDHTKRLKDVVRTPRTHKAKDSYQA